MNDEQPSRAAAILATDQAYFHQAKSCIESLRRVRRAGVDMPLDLFCVDLGLSADAIDWLERAGVQRRLPDPAVPRFRDAPVHAYAQSCRPYLPDSFPGYDIYMWVDSDLRFLRTDGITHYLDRALRPETTIAICLEADPTYRLVWYPPNAQRQLSDRWTRLSVAYGRDIALRHRVIASYNSGLYAARATSPIWGAFRERLLQAMDVPFHRLREQDALNVAIRDIGGVTRVPTTMNWICSMALPWQAPDGTWRHPEHRETPIRVLHLTGSTRRLGAGEDSITSMDAYRRHGLPVD